MFVSKSNVLKDKIIASYIRLELVQEIRGRQVVVVIALLVTRENSDENKKLKKGEEMDIIGLNMGH